MTRMYFSSRYWRFGRADGSVIAGKIRLRRDGTIEGYYHPNEARWGLDTHGLFFCRADGVVTTRFGFESSSPAVLKGIFLFNENITHTLTEIGMVPLPKHIRQLPQILPVRPNLGQPLLLNPDELDSFVITFAGTSEHPPHPNDLMEMLVVAPSFPVKITLALELNGFVSVIKPREVVNIVTYSGSDKHDPPRSSREHQYYAGFRWEAHVRVGLDAEHISRLEKFGWPQLFNIKWFFRGKEPSYLYHSVYVSDVKEKSEIEFFHITDTHVARRNDLIPEVLSETRNRDDARRFRLRYNNFNDNLRSLIRKANKENVDFIVMTGDLVDYYHDGILTDVDICLVYQDYEAGEPGERGGWLGNPAQETSNIRKFVEIVTGQDGRGEPLRCPIFCIPGNHDYLLMEPPLAMKSEYFLMLSGPPLFDPLIGLIGELIPAEDLLRDAEGWGVDIQEASEFEFWKRTKGDSLAERLERLRSDEGFDLLEFSSRNAVVYTTPEFNDFSQYLTEISYDTDFIVPVGPHRLICLNTGEDVFIPEEDCWLSWELLLKKILEGGDISNLGTLSTEEKHFLDGEDHNRGILLSHYDMINDAVYEAKSNQCLALLFTHAPLVREREPGTFDPSRVQWNKPAMVSGDEYCYYNTGDESKNSIPGLDGAIAEWDSRIPVPMVRWLQNGAGGVDAIFSGHSHDVREYRINNGIQVCKGEYSHDLQTIWPDRRDEWLDQHHPLQFTSGALKKSATKFRPVRIKDNYFQSFNMEDIPRFDKQDTMQIRYLFTALSIDLARFGGYHNEARNDLNPATHFYWAHAVQHRLMVMWDLMEKYWLQLLGVTILEHIALPTGDPSDLPPSLMEKLEQKDAALEEATARYRFFMHYNPNFDNPVTDYHSILSYNWHFIRHRNYLGEITDLISTTGINTITLDEKDATFKIVPGLADSRYISFESLNYPNYYLRHQGFRIKLHKKTDDELFKKDATFKKISGLANGSWISFESYNYPRYFIRHRNYHLFIEKGNTTLFYKAATFKIVDPPKRRRNQFFAICVATLNQFGLDFGSPKKNSINLKTLYEWAQGKDTSRLRDALEERIGKLVEFAHAGPCHLLAMWFASESVHLAPWSSWDNPARGSRDPGFHLAWALTQTREGILNELCEKYEFAARNQYQSLKDQGLEEFYIYHSVRMAAGGASVGFLDEQPDPVYFQSLAAKLKAIVEYDSTAWVDLIIRDLQFRVKQTGFPLCDLLSYIEPSGVAKILFSIPGFGSDSALVLAEEIKTIDRFKSDSSLALYLGMCPLDERWKRDKVNTRAEDAMWIGVNRHRKFVLESQRYYEKKRAEGKSHNRAIQALGRHMCRVIYTMLKEKREYQVACTQPPGVAKILFSIPGFGPDSALELAEEIKAIDRFKSDSSLALYLGMCPIDKRWKKDKVNTRAKDAMMAAVERHRKFVSESQRYYEKKRAEGKGHNRAIQALGRHMCHVIYKILREKREYYRIL